MVSYHGKLTKSERGHFYPYSYVANNAQGDTAINFVAAFSSPSGSSGAVAGHPSSSSDLFSCAEDGCVNMFSNYEELQLHLDAKCHLFMEEQDTTYDTFKKSGPTAYRVGVFQIRAPCHKSKQAIVLT